MKPFILIFFAVLGLVTESYSQANPKDGGKLEAYKIAYLTKKLNLNVEEAQRFWPIYNSYVNEIREVKRQHNRMDEVAFEERVVNIRKKYKNEFGHALTDDRANQFFKADKDFNNSLRKELQERQMDQLRQQGSRLKQN